MRSMKKLSIFVSIVMIFNLVVIPVFADNSDKSITINMISSTDTVQPGDTFEVDVNLSSNESFHSGIIGFDLSFNSNIFEYSDVNFYTSIDELGNNSSDWEELSGYNETTRHFVFGTLGTTVYAEGENTSNTVAKIFFRVKDKDEYGTQTIKIEKFNGVDSELNNLEASLPTIQISVVSDIVPTPIQRQSQQRLQLLSQHLNHQEIQIIVLIQHRLQQQLRQYQKVLCLLQHLK